MFVVLLPNAFHTNDMFALSEKSAEKKTKTGRLPIAHYKQKPAGSDLWPVNRCIPKNYIIQELCTIQWHKLYNLKIACPSLPHFHPCAYIHYFNWHYTKVRRKENDIKTLLKTVSSLQRTYIPPLPIQYFQFFFQYCTQCEQWALHCLVQYFFIFSMSRLWPLLMSCLQAS